MQMPAAGGGIFSVVTDGPDTYSARQAPPPALATETDATSHRDIETAPMFDNYHRLIHTLDQRATAIEENWSTVIHCRKGCDQCCRHITVFAVEAAHLSRAVDRLPPTAAAEIRRAAAESRPEGPCPLLSQGACRLYASRPVICRTQGLPLLVGRDGDPRIDFCPLNFQGVRTMPPEIVTDLDRLNDMLAAVNRLFVSGIGPTVVAGERYTIASALLTPWSAWQAPS